MRSTELRIGNAVYLLKGGEKKVYILEGVDIYKVDESDCFDIEPIPITEEWLTTLGFKKQLSYHILISGEMFKEGGKTLEVAWNDVNKWYVGFRNFTEDIGEVDDYVFLMNDMAYIHQLQNLFFALTNKELKEIW